MTTDTKIAVTMWLLIILVIVAVPIVFLWGVNTLAEYSTADFRIEINFFTWLAFYAAALPFGASYKNRRD